MKKQGLKADKDRNIDGCHFYKNRILLILRRLRGVPVFDDIDEIPISIDTKMKKT